MTFHFGSSPIFNCSLKRYNWYRQWQGSKKTLLYIFCTSVWNTWRLNTHLIVIEIKLFKLLGPLANMLFKAHEFFPEAIDASKVILTGVDTESSFHTGLQGMKYFTSWSIIERSAAVKLSTQSTNPISCNFDSNSKTDFLSSDFESNRIWELKTFKATCSLDTRWVSGSKMKGSFATVLLASMSTITHFSIKLCSSSFSILMDSNLGPSLHLEHARHSTHR